ncbi:MAG: hypothetical protein ABUT39_20075 [Acidobacteriota bacterium]
MAIDLDRRSYFGLTRARFTADGAGGMEPRRAFRRLGTVRPELRARLDAAAVRKYHRLLFLGYACSMLAGLLAGAAVGSLLLTEVLGAMQAAKELTPFLQKVYRLVLVLPALRLILMAAPLFLLAVAVDYLSYRSILETIDKAQEPLPEEP